jgi:tetratricopeptide (TPR) repeat protein
MDNRHTHSWQRPPALSHALRSAQEEADAGHEQFSRRQWLDARHHFLQASHLEPERADFHFAVAMCDWANGQMDNAGAPLQTAVRLSPKWAAAQAWLGEWYLSQGIIESALQATGAAMALQPTNGLCMLSRAWVLKAAGDPDGAWELAKKLVGHTEMTFSLARLYGELAGRYGEHEQALTIIHRLIATGVPSGESSIYFTAAQLLDATGRYDEAFALVTRAGSSYAGQPYDPAAETGVVDALTQYFTRQRLASIPRASFRSDKPVFIVGMPRSGTSLVEQILASHPSIYGAGELDFMFRVFLGTLDMLRSSPADYPACLDKVTKAELDGMADIYLGPFLALKPDAKRIADKMPLNFLHLGLIATLLPGARVIHCVRDPMDTCLSCFLTHFNHGHHFKHNLAHTGHFYRQYERLMVHWKSVLDLPILEVCYEQLIANPEAQSRRMIEFLGVPWDDRCLNFHNTRRPCVTASSLQVRKPIYDTSVRRWKNYERHLAPLKTALWSN